MFSEQSSPSLSSKHTSWVRFQNLRSNVPTRSLTSIVRILRKCVYTRVVIFKCNRLRTNWRYDKRNSNNLLGLRMQVQRLQSLICSFNSSEALYCQKNFSSKEISKETKGVAMQKLEQVDKSDLLARTKRYCEAALPTIEDKRACWV